MICCYHNHTVAVLQPCSFNFRNFILLEVGVSSLLKNISFNIRVSLSPPVPPPPPPKRKKVIASCHCSNHCHQTLFSSFLCLQLMFLSYTSCAAKSEVPLFKDLCLKLGFSFTWLIQPSVEIPNSWYKLEVSQATAITIAVG